MGCNVSAFGNLRPFLRLGRGREGKEVERRKGDGKGQAGLMRGFEGLGRAYVSDIRNYEPVEQLVDQVVREFGGRLDIMVANAGIPWTQGSFLDGEVRKYGNVMTTDLDSVYYCARAAGRHWRRQKMVRNVTPCVFFFHQDFLSFLSLFGQGLARVSRPCERAWEA